MALIERPNAWRISRAADSIGMPLEQKRCVKIGTISPAGTASGCMRWLGGTTPEERADLPDVMAREGGAWDGVRGRSFLALVDATTVGCAARDTVRGRCPRLRSHHDGRRMRAR